MALSPAPSVRARYRQGSRTAEVERGLGFPAANAEEVRRPPHAMVRGAPPEADDLPAGTARRPSGRQPSRPCSGGASGQWSRPGGNRVPGRPRGGADPVDDPAGPAQRPSVTGPELGAGGRADAPGSAREPRPARPETASPPTGVGSAVTGRAAARTAAFRATRAAIGALAS